VTWLRFTVAALLTFVIASAVLERQRRADLARLRARQGRAAHRVGGQPTAQRPCPVEAGAADTRAALTATCTTSGSGRAGTRAIRSRRFCVPARGALLATRMHSTTRSRGDGWIGSVTHPV